MISQRHVCSLGEQVSQKRWVSLDAVSLLVIVSEVLQLPSKVSPHSLHSCWVKQTQMDHFVLQGQHAGTVGALQMEHRTVNI